MKQLTLLALIFSTLGVFAQNELNDYKFIIVPKKFDCFKSQNEHKTSTLIKYLFAQNGFEVYYQDQLPEELAANRCLGVLVDLEENSSLFSTKTKLIFKDCNMLPVFKTIEGISKQKDYIEAYHEAIKESFVSIQRLNHVYTKKAPSAVEIATKDVKEKKLTREEIVEEVAEETPVKSQNLQEPLKEERVAITPEVRKEDSAKSLGILYAQATENGYQLVDSTPKVKMKLFNTSKIDYFLATADDVNGVVFKENNSWYFEYFEKGETKKDKLNIKF